MANLVSSARDLLRTDLPDDFSDDKEMPILEHLEELRNRIIIVAVALVVTTAFAFIFTPAVFEILKRPAPSNTQLVFIEVTEMFVTYFKVALVTGAGLSMPVIVYQLIRFVAPALTRREKRLLITMLPFLSLFFFAGAVFGYFVTLPFAIKYLLTFSDVATAQIRIGNYITFVTTILFWMGTTFELPIVMLVLAKIRVVTAQRFSKFRKYWILVAFVVAAVITPTPDPLNQTLVAVPLIVLYELGVLLVRLAGPPKETAR